MKPQVHQFEHKLLEFAYGELPPGEARALEAHLKGCSKCAQSLSAIQGVRQTMARLPEEPAPEVGLDSLLAYAEQAARRASVGPSPRPTWWRRLVWPLAGATAASLLVVLTVQVVERVSLKPQKGDYTVEGAEATAAPAAPAALAQAPAAPPPLWEGQAQAEPAMDRGAEEAQLLDRETVATSKLAGPSSPQLAQRSERKQQAEELRELAGKASQYEQNKPGKGMEMAKAERVDALADKEAPRRKKDLGDLTNEKKANRDAEERLAAASPAPAQPAALGNIGEVASGRAKADDDYSRSTAPGAQLATKSAAPSSQRQSLGIHVGGSYGSSSASESQGWSSAPAPSSRAVELGMPRPKPSEEAAPQSEVATREKDYSVEDREKQRTVVLESLLSQARAADAAGDIKQEIQLAHQVLSREATGYQRAEALRKLCDAYEKAGMVEQSDRYCQLLIKEFPNSAAAKQVAERRRGSRSKAAEKTKRPSYDEAEQLPRQAAPAEAAPAMH
ncbi:MAG: zf-HC2 domain-containing protein [Myxococcales bacterium]|nr:zf-HC2 domain-containing protein [Myxococcales bacterium]